MNGQNITEPREKLLTLKSHLFVKTSDPSIQIGIRMKIELIDSFLDACKDSFVSFSLVSTSRQRLNFDINLLNACHQLVDLK